MNQAEGVVVINNETRGSILSKIRPILMVARAAPRTPGRSTLHTDRPLPRDSARQVLLEGPSRSHVPVYPRRSCGRHIQRRAVGNKLRGSSLYQDIIHAAASLLTQSIISLLHLYHDLP